MKKEETQLEEITLVGITTRANNSYLFEADTKTNKIAATVQKYFYNEVATSISHCANPFVTCCVCTKHERDVNHDDAFFIDEKVTSFKNNLEVKMLSIPSTVLCKVYETVRVYARLC